MNQATSMMLLFIIKINTRHPRALHILGTVPHCAMCAARGLGMGVPGLLGVSIVVAVLGTVKLDVFEDDSKKKQRRRRPVDRDMVPAARSDPTLIGSTARSS